MSAGATLRDAALAIAQAFAQGGSNWALRRPEGTAGGSVVVSDLGITAAYVCRYVPATPANAAALTGVDAERWHVLQPVSASPALQGGDTLTSGTLRFVVGDAVVVDGYGRWEAKPV